MIAIDEDTQHAVAIGRLKLAKPRDEAEIVAAEVAALARIKHRGHVARVVAGNARGWETHGWRTWRADAAGSDIHQALWDLACAAHADDAEVTRLRGDVRRSRVFKWWCLYLDAYLRQCVASALRDKLTVDARALAPSTLHGCCSMVDDARREQHARWRMHQLAEGLWTEEHETIYRESAR